MTAWAPTDDARGARTRVGFLFNHEGLHQVAHTAPVISALQRHAPELCIEVLTSSAAQENAVLGHLDPTVRYPTFCRLRASLSGALAERALGGAVPLRRIATLKANLGKFRTYDALVVPETTSTLLKTRYGLDSLKLIHLPHGAGDRAVGFSPQLRSFDFVLVSGEKIRRRMLQMRLIRPDDHAVIGYPKFDSAADGERERFFADDRPVVLYNPHFDPHLSSWYSHGEAVLDFFAAQRQFNLIFAPHVMLFRRKLHVSFENFHVRWRRRLPRRFLTAPNILIDPGSQRSVDMTYVRAADIYLGDASSQIYEFIATPRPAVFLNVHDAYWHKDPDYAHWNLGPVVNGIPALARELEHVLPHNESYRRVQEKGFRDTFSIDPERPAAERAARAIAHFLSRSTSGKAR